MLIGFHALTGADAASGFYRQSVNYQAKIWYDFESSSAPEDPQHYGYTFNGQYLLPLCHTKVACPNVLQNVNADESNSDSESNSDDSSNEDLCQSDETDDDNED